MTDRELATYTVEVNHVELLARASVDTGADSLAERDVALATVRQAVALRRALESWIVQRATRALR